jgi:NAD(P)-dependent dehydrogenase (short-subunit alcohol dehydrogenase family)
MWDARADERSTTRRPGLLVTGGARGIGLSTAELLERRGAVPVPADVDAEAASMSDRVRDKVVE